MEEEEILDGGEGGGPSVAAILVAVVLLGLIGAAVWYFFFREKKVETEMELPKWEAPQGVAEEQVFEALPELIINPADSEGRYFLVVKINVVYNDRKAIYDKMAGKPWRLPQVQNLIIDIFSRYTVQELQTPKFKEEARKRITDELNALLGWTAAAAAEGEEEKAPPPIERIDFSQYVLQ